jgi:hypothetical protein
MGSSRAIRVDLATLMRRSDAGKLRSVKCLRAQVPRRVARKIPGSTSDGHDVMRTILERMTDPSGYILQDLREATGIMVDIQARFLSVQDNFLEDIGVDFRGLGQPGPGTNTFFNYIIKSIKSCSLLTFKSICYLP